MQHRVFIAINLPSEVKEKLVQLKSNFKRLSNIKWVETPNIHLTIKFLGDLTDEQIEIVKEILMRIVREKKQCPLIVDDLLFLPNKNKPRVIALSVRGEGVKIISEIYNNLEKELAKVKIGEREDRGFTPHITIGRVKGPLGGKLSEFDIEPLTFCAETIDLVESQLTLTGPIYKMIKKFALC